MIKAKIIAGILAMCVTIPLWFYVLYNVLSAINAPTHVWFAFWIYVPATIVTATIAHIATSN